MSTAAELAFLCHTVWMIFGTSGQRHRLLPHGVILMMIEYIIQSTDINKYRQKNKYKRSICTISPELKDALKETLIPAEGMATDLIIEDGSRKKLLPRDVVSEIISFIEFDDIRERRFRYMVERVKQYLMCKPSCKVIFVNQIMGMEIQLTMVSDVSNLVRWLSAPFTTTLAVIMPATYQYNHPRHYLQLNFDYIALTDFNYRFFEELESIMMWQPASFHVLPFDQPIPKFTIPDAEIPTERLRKIIWFCQIFWAQDELEKNVMVQIINGVQYKTVIGRYKGGRYCILTISTFYKKGSTEISRQHYSRINSYGLHNIIDEDYTVISQLLSAYDAGNYKWEPHDPLADYNQW